MISLDLERARKNSRVREALSRLCDFDMSPNRASHDWFRIESPTSFEPVAGDAAGGVFLVGSDGRMAYVSSEGQAGTFAASPEQAFTLFVTFPYWRDLLKFSGGGNLSEMSRAAPFLEKELLDDVVTAESDRSLLRSELNVELDAGSIAALHRAVLMLGADVRVLGEDGNRFAPLFNKFTVDHNRGWASA